MRASLVRLMLTYSLVLAIPLALQAGPGKGNGGHRQRVWRSRSLPSQARISRSRRLDAFEAGASQRRTVGSSGLRRASDRKDLAVERLRGRHRAVEVQRRNEERKLTQRRANAERLRELSRHNGNQNLLDTADRKDQKADEHYERRLEQIDALEAQTESVDSPTTEGQTPMTFYDD